MHQRAPHRCAPRVLKFSCTAPHQHREKWFLGAPAPAKSDFLCTSTGIFSHIWNPDHDTRLRNQIHWFTQTRPIQTMWTNELGPLHLLLRLSKLDAMKRKTETHWLKPVLHIVRRRRGLLPSRRTVLHLHSTFSKTRSWTEYFLLFDVLLKSRCCRTSFTLITSAIAWNYNK